MRGAHFHMNRDHMQRRPSVGDYLVKGRNAMKMIPFTNASSSDTIYINPAQVLYCVASDRHTSEGRKQTNICFLKGRDVTIVGTVDEVATKLMAE